MPPMAEPAQQPRPGGGQRVEALRATISRIMTAHHVPGLSIAVTSAQQLRYADAFGYADLARGRATTTDTGYLWFSMSKIVTATAALRLADDGRLDLDAPVTTFVPTYTERPGRVAPRIRQLLNHTAGAPNPLPLRWVQPAWQSPDAAHEKVEALLARTRPTRPVGETARYSNLGYLILAAAVAAAAGEPFEQYAQRLCSNRPACSPPATPAHRMRDYATGYLRLPRLLTPVVKTLLPRASSVTGPDSTPHSTDSGSSVPATAE